MSDSTEEKFADELHAAVLVYSAACLLIVKTCQLEFVSIIVG